CAASARVNVSVLYQFVDTANWLWPTWRRSARWAFFPAGQRVARSLPERWPADYRAERTHSVQGHQHAHREGQPGRCPSKREGGVDAHRENANIDADLGFIWRISVHASSGVIWGMSVKALGNHCNRLALTTQQRKGGLIVAVTRDRYTGTPSAKFNVP